MVVFLCLAYALQWGNNPLPFITFLVTTTLSIFMGLLLYKLTVEINGATLRLSYGIGLISLKFEIKELKEVKVVRVPWYYGIGIRITPSGMLYSIHGWDALRITFKNKGKSKTVMVGTAEPEQLKQALEDKNK